MRLVVNLPTFQEAENIEEMIGAVLKAAKKLKNVDVHIVVSDSHSKDGTREIVSKISKINPKVHYLDVKVRGLGVGTVKGHRYAIDKLKADILAQMDADLSHDPNSLAQMLSYIEKGYDLVVGSRLIKGGKNQLQWHRRLFTNGASIICRLLWGEFKLTEFTNSYRVFTKELFEKINFDNIPWKSRSYIIQPSFLHASIAAGAKIKEVPIVFKDRKNGISKTQITSYVLDVLKFGFKVRLKKSKRILKFLTVGFLGYVVNAIILGLLNRGALYTLPVLASPMLFFIPQTQNAPQLLFITVDRLLISSIISIEASIIFNFIFHETWTYRDRLRKEFIAKRFLKFNFTSIGSPLVQLASILFFAKILGLHEQIGLAAGVILGLFINYTLNMVWIWKKN